MKHFIKLGRIVQRVFIAGCAVVVLQSGKPSPTPEIYMATSPCDGAVRPFLNIPLDMQCEMIRWKLALFRNPEKPDQSRYALEYSYGMAKAGTQGLVNGGTQNTQHGSWKVTAYHGSLPGKNLMELQPENKKTPLAFIRLDERLLHMLDTKNHLMIGNAAWSYTLNKVPNPSI